MNGYVIALSVVVLSGCQSLDRRLSPSSAEPAPDVSNAVAFRPQPIQGTPQRRARHRRARHHREYTVDGHQQQLGGSALRAQGDRHGLADRDGAAPTYGLKADTIRELREDRVQAK